jgi:hypothetical protein
MAMYLARVPITTIQQLIGRWKSSAFMRDIREQVDCFTSNISSGMIRTFVFLHNTKTENLLQNYKSWTYQIMAHRRNH